MIKMVVSSFYNALIDSEEAIPTTTMLEIERIRNKNILFSICTNRTYKEVLEYNKDFPFIDYIISLNGSYVWDVVNKKCIFKSKLTKTNINKITNLFEKDKITYYSSDNTYNSINEDIDIYKIEVEIDKDFKLDILDKINVNKSVFEKDNKRYLEITSSKTSMFTGTDKICIKTSLNLNEVLVIASNESDISLVSNIKNSYIMKNSSNLLKKIGSNKTNSNDSKGVENILKKL